MRKKGTKKLGGGKKMLLVWGFVLLLLTVVGTSQMLPPRLNLNAIQSAMQKLGMKGDVEVNGGPKRDVLQRYAKRDGLWWFVEGIERGKKKKRTKTPVVLCCVTGMSSCSPLHAWITWTNQLYRGARAEAMHKKRRKV